ncbi:uncharacterized protein EAF02_007063 [Botrytis sinoallii]|uniref:uncharacterized protein n=1 Tax=Botrytis sinoallii TaxID=1463999 RepID=UPI001900ADD9|nr:uncharacterized protein EAF02_007063 [Botrytis sinoallii]KAF7881172.1 hypothetical protein EAF02_007063 [Botrytis sinoallii]
MDHGGVERYPFRWSEAGGLRFEAEKHYRLTGDVNLLETGSAKRLRSGTPREIICFNLADSRVKIPNAWIGVKE